MSKTYRSPYAKPRKLSIKRIKEEKFEKKIRQLEKKEVDKDPITLICLRG